MDTHAHAGYIVPPTYDSMIGKLIVYGRDREHAIKRMHRALSEFTISGIRTTIPFHLKMMKNKDFISNNFDTKYLEKYKG